MKIDASRYTMFWSNPERYRLREIWKLAPKEPEAGTFASLLTYGRRRGTCFHELLDADYRKIPAREAKIDLENGGFGEKEIGAAERMFWAVKEKYPDEQYLAHEVLFEYPIPDSPHSMVGRIDHILKDDEGAYVGDWKTSKQRTKAEINYKLDDYCRSDQVSFYLLGARQLGFESNRFLYRLVVDGKKGVEVHPRFTQRTGLELKEFARGVHITCELIEFLKVNMGITRPWPILAERFSSDYAAIIGQRMYKGYMPDGFEPKKEHLELMREAETDAVQA